MRSWLLALFSLASLPAAATTPTLEQPPTLTCLTPAPGHRGTPAYPDEAWRQGLAGRVMVELSFTTPDLRPAMKVLDSAGGRDFLEAVDTHVRTLRLPCLQASDVPALLRLDYVFKPTNRQTPAAVLPDPQQAERERLLACLQQPRDGPPDYPLAARRDGVQGRLVVRLHFTSADGPPEVSVVSRPGSAVFVRPATRWAQNYRLPCYQGAGLRIEVVMIYRFEGDNPGFRDIGLRRFVGLIRGIQHQRVSFDFNAMACPFELRLN